MVARALVVIVVLLACGIAVVALRVEIIREGHRIRLLEERQHAAQQEGRRLDAAIHGKVTAERATIMNEKLHLGLAPPDRAFGDIPLVSEGRRP